MEDPPPNCFQLDHGLVNCSPLIDTAYANQSTFDAQITCLLKPYPGSLSFDVSVIGDTMVTHKEYVTYMKLQAGSIVKYVTGQTYPWHTLIFSRDIYPLPFGCLSSPNLSDVFSWIVLRKDLCQATHVAYNSLSTNEID